MKFRLWLCIVSLLLVCRCWAGPVALSLVPSTNSVNNGDTMTVEAVISGLGAPGPAEVGSFDIFVGYNATLLAWEATDFTNLLGNPVLGEAITLSDTTGSTVEALDVSLLTIPQLDALQPASFTLATFTFIAIGDGKVTFQNQGGPIDDGNGNLIAGTKTPSVPEPSALLLLLPAFGVCRFFGHRPR
jgi:hypothetical protein